MTPTETQWIAACLRSVGRASPPPPPPELDWDRVLGLAEAEAVAPALGFVFGVAAPEGVPARVRARLARDFDDGTARHLLLSAELESLVGRFTAAGIPLIPLKGPALAEMLYPRPGMRPSSDLDVLIRREALLDADARLQRLGYRRVRDDHSWAFDVAHDRATVYEGPRGVRVDLHWSLLGDPRFRWNDADARTVWQRVIDVPLGRRAVPSLCPEDLLIYLAAHLAVHHGLAGLLWYWDLARLLERFGGTLDWAAVARRAARWRAGRPVYFALSGCRTLFGASPPAVVMSRLRPRGPRAAAVRWLVRRCDASRRRRLEHLIALLLVERARDVAASAARSVWPSRDWLRLRYERRSLAAGYLAHWGRAARVARELTRAALRGVVSGGR